MIFAWRKSSKEFRGCRPLPPPPTPSTSRRSLCRPLLQPVGRNARQDSSSTNNALNNNSRSSLARRIRTATAATAVAVVMAVSLAIAPPTPLLIRVCGPPTSTPGSTLFKCGRVPEGGGGRHPATPPVSTSYGGRRPSLRSSTAGRAALHATTRASAHSPWSAAGSSAPSSGGMVPMDGLVGSTIAGQLCQHHDHGPSCGHRLGGRLRRP
jgi:hypothetical protein